MNSCEARRLPNGNMLITVPIDLRWKGNGNGRRVAAGKGTEASEDARKAFLLAVARGRRWQRMLDEGRAASGREIARMIGRDPGFVLRCIRLAHVSPRIVEEAVRGEVPLGLSVELARKAIPDSWAEQKEMLRGK